MRRYTLITLSILAIFLLSSTVMAQPHQDDGRQRGQHWHGPGYAGLSPEQHEALTALHKEHRQAVMLPKLELKAKQAELDVLLVAPQADQIKIAAVTNEITALYGKILGAQNDYRRKVFEKTGHLIRGGMEHGAQRHGMGGMGGQMRNCPMMSPL